MTGPGLTAARNALGLSRQGLAERLGITRMTLHRYETGVHPVPQVVALAVKCLATHKP